MRENIRNVAIIAHVDHGKTTLVDCLLQDSGYSSGEERVMDKNDLEKEKGITIMAKATAVNYKGCQINIVDTPGHSDFGGEVERIMTMVDGVILLVCATEGPMAQTKYVLKKAIQANKKVIVIVNKVDRPTARVEEVENEIFDLFCEVDSDEKFSDFITMYASGKEGWATPEFDENKLAEYGSRNTLCVLDSIIDGISCPQIDESIAEFSMLGSQVDFNNYFGKIIRGKVNSGTIETHQLINVYDQDNNLVQTGKVSKLFKNMNLADVEINKASAGEIISIAGLSDAKINCVILDKAFAESNPGFTIKGRDVDAPLLMTKVKPNSSPMSGKSENYTFGALKDRFLKEAEIDAALRVELLSNELYIYGRGDLHLGILFEKVRREQYEFELSAPSVVTKEGPKGEILQPIEDLKIECDIEHIPILIERLMKRRAYVSDCYDIDNDRHVINAQITSKGKTFSPLKFFRHDWFPN